MKQIIVILFSLTQFAFGQTTGIPATDSLGELVQLPQLRRGEMPNFFEVSKQSSYLFTVKDSAQYYEIFNRFTKESLPSIDFSVNELLLQAYCAQCVAGCNHKGTENEPCHRNSCSFTYRWFIKKRG